MSLVVGLSLIVFSIALLLAAMAIVKLLARRYGLGAEVQRKLVHVATGLYALTLPLTFHDRWPVVLLVLMSIAVMAALRLPQFSRTGLASTLHGVERKSYGEIYLTCAVGFLFFQSQAQPILYVLPILTLTLSDAAAALIGTRYGHRRFPVEGGVKSVEGVIAFFVVTWLLAMILLLAMTEAPRLSVIVLGLLVAAFGALVEADSWRGLDNLFVPLSLYVLLQANLDAPVAKLILLTLLFVAAIIVMRRAAPLLKLSRHAARAATILIFLICSVATPREAVLPILAMLAHLAARRARPCRSQFPDLDFLATISGVSLFWLFVGRYYAHPTIDLFGLTFAAATGGLLALALKGRWRWLLIPALAILLGLDLSLTGWNSVEIAWHGTLWPWAAATLALGAATPLLRPEWFDRFRSPRIMANALALPLCLFVTKGILG